MPRAIFKNIIFFITLMWPIISLCQYEKLLQEGFDQIIEDDKIVYVEHQALRNPLSSFNKLNEYSEDLPFAKVITYHHMPIMGFINKGTYFLPEKLRVKNNQKQFQIRLQPNVRTRFGYFTDPYEVKLGMIFDSRIYLASGLSFIGGLEVPVQNNLDNQSGAIRPAPSMLNFMKKLSPSDYIAVSTGLFFVDRYGFDFEYRHQTLFSNFSYGFETSYTGFYRFDGFRYTTRNFSSLSLIADAEYQMPFENLSLRLSAGRWLFEDFGFRLDLTRRFDRAEYGLYVASTDFGSSAGFQFACQLFPGVIAKHKKVLLRTTEEFRYKYSYDSQLPAARKFQKSVPRLADILRNFNH
tara:strand:- start:1383 stop:2438 length:1056 start_codon:yes stop_codon:yes gene_type:complete